MASVRLVVDSGGEVVASFSHDEWGVQDSATGDAGLSTHTYVGALNVRNENASSGLLLMGHRWYDASLGRFLTRDPIGVSGGLNLYAYADNDPIGHVDSAGLDPSPPKVTALSSSQRETLGRVGPLLTKYGAIAYAKSLQQLLSANKVVITPALGNRIGGQNCNAWIAFSSASFDPSAVTKKIKGIEAYAGAFPFANDSVLAAIAVKEIHGYNSAQKAPKNLGPSFTINGYTGSMYLFKEEYEGAVAADRFLEQAIAREQDPLKKAILEAWERLFQEQLDKFKKNYDDACKKKPPR